MVPSMSTTAARMVDDASGLNPAEQTDQRLGESPGGKFLRETGECQQC